MMTTNSVKIMDTVWMKEPQKVFPKGKKYINKQEQEKELGKCDQFNISQLKLMYI